MLLHPFYYYYYYYSYSVIPLRLPYTKTLVRSYSKVITEYALNGYGSRDTLLYSRVHLLISALPCTFALLYIS